MNSTLKGNELEDSIGTLLETEIEEGRFWAKRECCILSRKKSYFSRDRDSHITFDLSIEIHLPNASQYSVLVLIECKNYKNPVGVEDVEEFFAKIQQVAGANVKGILATNSAFQSGALTYAKAKGLGLLRYFGSQDFKWELHRSPSLLAIPATDSDAYSIQAALVAESYRSTIFDFLGQTPAGAANSLWQFFSGIIEVDHLDRKTINGVRNSNRPPPSVPYLKREEITDLANGFLEPNTKGEREVSLEEITDKLRRSDGLAVHHLPRQAAEEVPQMLGKINFQPLEIRIYRQQPGRRGRERFTLAHELGHYALGHSKFFRREYCDQGDLDRLKNQTKHPIPAIERMEWQANYFASALLMPQKHVEQLFWAEIERLAIPNKGHGPLFVDKQPANLTNFFVVTNTLKAALGVSRTAIASRLSELGLLNDSRRN